MDVLAHLAHELSGGVFCDPFYAVAGCPRIGRSGGLDRGLAGEAYGGDQRGGNVKSSFMTAVLDRGSRTLRPL